MTPKEKIIKAVQGLPEDASLEDAMERLLFLAETENGLQKSDPRKAYPHEKIRHEMKRWVN